MGVSYCSLTFVTILSLYLVAFVSGIVRFVEFVSWTAGFVSPFVGCVSRIVGVYKWTLSFRRFCSVRIRFSMLLEDFLDTPAVRKSEIGTYMLGEHQGKFDKVGS